MKKLFVLAFVAAVLILMAGKTALACFCAGPETVKAAFDGSPNVIVAKLQAVEKKEPGDNSYGYGNVKSSKLTVEKVYKGNLKPDAVLTFKQGGGGDCVWTFSEKVIGDEFLLFLDDKSKTGGMWAVYECSRSSSVKSAKADLTWLDKMAKVAGKTRLSGTMTREIKSATDDVKSVDEPLANKNIRISGNGKVINLKTNVNGVFEIYDLPAGTYRVEPEKINGYKMDDEDDNANGFISVELKAKDHADADINFVVNNQIRGKVFDPSGSVMQDVCVRLLPAHGKEARYFNEFSCTNKKGEFKFKELPAGSYVIVINRENEITSDEPFGTFYYPSATKREDAAIINIGAGEMLDNINVFAPTIVETITVTGQFLYADGKPVIDNLVKFQLPGNDEYQAAARANTDAQGRFAIKILKGQKGQLHGEMFTYEGDFENCPKLDKLIRASGEKFYTAKTQSVDIEAVTDLQNVELKFSFPACDKAKRGE